MEFVLRMPILRLVQLFAQAIGSLFKSPHLWPMYVVEDPSMITPYHSFNSWSLRLILVVGALVLLLLKYAASITGPELVSTQKESAEVVFVGMQPDANQTYVSRHGTTAGPVGGLSPTGRVRLDNGTEFFVQFHGGRPETGSRIDVEVQNYEDGSQRVSTKVGLW